MLKEESTTTKTTGTDTFRDQVDAVKAFDALSKSINDEIGEMEKTKDFKSATDHRKEMDEIKRAWIKIEDVRRQNKEANKQIEKKLEDIEKKKEEETAWIDAQWERIEKARAAR